jgi:hypothetical protein
MGQRSVIFDLFLSSVCAVTIFVGGVTWADGTSKRQLDARPVTVSEILNVVQSEVARLQNTREVYTWEYESPRLRTPHFCFQECACLANKISTEIARLWPALPVKTVILKPLNAMGLKMISMDRKRLINFDYHVALEVKLGSTEWVIDPILTGPTVDPMIEKSIWLTHFSNMKIDED